MKLLTVPTANGQRASVALEECGFAYEVRNIDFSKGEHRSEEVLAANPLGRLPVLIDEDAGSKVYGSMAIVQYAARTSGKLLPTSGQESAADHWAGIIMTDLSPAFASQFHLSVLAPEPFEWGLEYYAQVIARVLAMIDAHLESNEYFLGDNYSMIDVLMYPTAATSTARMESGLDPYPAIRRWRDVVAARPAVERGMQVSGSM